MDFEQLVCEIPELGKFTDQDLVELFQDQPTLLLKSTTKLYTAKDTVVCKHRMIKLEYEGMIGTCFKVKYYNLEKLQVVEETMYDDGLCKYTKGRDHEYIYEDKYTGFLYDSIRDRFMVDTRLKESDLHQHVYEGILVKKVAAPAFSYNVF